MQPRPLRPARGRLSPELQLILGKAIVDRAFRARLLTNPRRALASFNLTADERRAACGITGLANLAEYAVLLEERYAGSRRRRLNPLPEAAALRKAS
jgi:hypothetical protein